VDEETQFRLQHYEPQVHNRRTGQPEYRCPHCWIREGDDGRRPLRPGNGTDQYDVLKCDEPHCVGEFIVPFDS
jgi:hypothetical protein